MMMTRKQRKLESSDDRKVRLEKKAHQRDEEAKSAEDAIDEMVKRSIKKHGP